jgi:parvulin-like peptidyl-prolyl isomerase
MSEQNLILAKENDGDLKEPRDWTRFIWLSVIILLIVMMFSFYWMRSPRPITTMVRARHILVTFDSSDPVDRGRAHERISELRNRILAGESFEDLAREYSDDSSNARRGGDLGWAPPGTYAAAFEEYCWKGEIGQVSDILQTQYGFHLVRVEDRHIASADLHEREIERKVLEGQEEKTGTPEALKAKQ